MLFLISLIKFNNLSYLIVYMLCYNYIKKIKIHHLINGVIFFFSEEIVYIPRPYWLILPLRSRHGFAFT